MGIKTIVITKRLLSALSLTAGVLIMVALTQPEAVTEPIEPKLITSQVAVFGPVMKESTLLGPEVQPRTYAPRENATSRGEAVAKPTTDFMYTVKQGDTLYDLALAYGVTVEQIMIANDLNSDKLSLNQKLLIPASGKVTKVAKTTTPKATKVSSEKKSNPTQIVKPVSRATYSGRVQGELIGWNKAQVILGRGETATLIDVNTGNSFKVKRKGGTNHADCEPLTATDSAIMKKLYGGGWSWNRRAVVVSVDGKNIAASMAGMPHGSQTISNNGFQGHFDLHFLGSMTHGSSYTRSGVAQVDKAHQSMVQKAAGQ